MMNLMAYENGDNNLIKISEIIGKDVFVCANITESLKKNGLLEKING